ncbi:mediator of RNA polymerase II transcription subunit 1-like [Ptychodera flava]|uniref:mediator of RNA polymerase II transcription subunit 1-like n=1 Tax=Ptychodera flava TaxID=63121 RepID=UPI003969E85C
MASAEGAMRVAATMNGPNLPNADSPPTGKEAVLTALMQKLKTASDQVKTWSETSRKLRQAVAKFKEPDAVDPNRLQKCLDSLKKAIKVTSLHSMGERLEALARQCGLKYSPGPAGTGTDVFISSDMFYVEVMMDNSGNVKDVKVAHHNSDPQSCLELKIALKKNDFKEFAEHLRELNQLYQFTGDNSQKTRAFMSLQALESDVATLFQMQGSFSNNPLMIILKGPVGYLTPRSGGRPAQLTYYVSPYDLLNVETGTTTTLSMKEPVPRTLGFSVAITIESAPLHKLQTTPLLNIPMSPDGKRPIGAPAFIPLGNPNSTTLPASFIVKLNKPMPLSTSSIRQIQIHTGMHFVDASQAIPLNSLICKHYSTNNQSPSPHVKTTNYNTFFVTLPDQHHCYFINECSCGPEMKGVIVSKIAFTHPAHIPQILMHVRQQAVYNTLISSCVRNSGKQDVENSILFDVTPVTPQRISVSFEHPIHEGMACVEFDLSDLVNVKCRLHTPPGEQPLCSDEYATKVLQKCMSIPVTMRSILKKVADQQQQKDGLQRVGASGYASYPYSSGDISGFIPNAGRLNTGMSLGISKSEHQPTGGTQGRATGPSGLPMDKSISVQRYKGVLNELPSGALGSSPFGRSISNTNVTVDQEGLLGPVGVMGMLSDDSKISQNPMLATLLQTTGANQGEGGVDGGQGKGRNPMLMNLLQDQGTPLPSNVTQPQQIKPTRKRKRKSTTDRSPKRQQSEEEFTKELSAMDIDSTLSYDMSVHTDTPTPTVSDPVKLQTITMQSSSPFRDGKSEHSKSMESTDVSAMLSDIMEQNPKFSKRTSKRADSSGSSRTGQSPKRVSTPTDGAPPKLTTISTPEHVMTHGDTLSMSSVSEAPGSQDNYIPGPDSPGQPDLFTKPDSDVFTAADLIAGGSAASNSDNMDPDFTEPLEFNTDALNPDSNFDTQFLDSKTEGSSDLDIATCDTSGFAFGSATSGKHQASNTAASSSASANTMGSGTSSKSTSSASSGKLDTEKTDEKDQRSSQSSDSQPPGLISLSDEVLDLSMTPRLKSPFDIREKETSLPKPVVVKPPEPPLEIKIKRSSEYESGKKKGKKRESRKGDADGESSSSKRKQDSKRERSSKRRKGDGSRSPSRGRKSPPLGGLPPVTVTIPKLGTPPTTLMTAKQTAPLKTTIRTVTITSEDGTRIKKPMIVKPVIPPMGKSSQTKPGIKSSSSSQGKSSPSQRNTDSPSSSKSGMKTITIKPPKKPQLPPPLKLVPPTTTQESSGVASTASSASSTTVLSSTPSSASTTTPSPQPSSAAVSPTKSQTSPLFGNKSKSPIRSRKGSLSAVIDKLKESASSVNVKSSIGSQSWMDGSNEKEDGGAEKPVGGKREKKSLDETSEKKAESKMAASKQPTQKIVTAQNISSSTPTSTPVKPILVVRTVAVTTLSMTPPTTVLSDTSTGTTMSKVRPDGRPSAEQVVEERESPESPEEVKKHDDHSSKMTTTPASPDVAVVTDQFVPVIPLEAQDEKPSSHQSEETQREKSKQKNSNGIERKTMEKKAAKMDDTERPTFRIDQQKVGKLTETNSPEEDEDEEEDLPYLIETESQSKPAERKGDSSTLTVDASTDTKTEKNSGFKLPPPLTISSSTEPQKKAQQPSPGNESDDDGLVIDDAPQTKLDSKSSDTQTETEIKSPRSVMAQSPLAVMAKSPLMVKSPATKSPISISGASEPSHHSTTDSPCVIDDDLMDEALLYKD